MVAGVFFRLDAVPQCHLYENRDVGLGNGAEIAEDTMGELFGISKGKGNTRAGPKLRGLVQIGSLRRMLAEFRRVGGMGGFTKVDNSSRLKSFELYGT